MIGCFHQVAGLWVVIIQQAEIWNGGTGCIQIGYQYHLGYSRIIPFLLLMPCISVSLFRSSICDLDKIPGFNKGLFDG